MLIYFDLNIFDRIEKIERLEEKEQEAYQTFEELILHEKIIVPYSNAHLNDLFRGYQKNPSFIEGHLTNIERLTKNLCVCQYWNRKTVTWHYRNIFEFFESKKNEREFEHENVSELFESIGMPSLIEPFKYLILPKEWKQGYSAEPLFGIMFPKSRVNPTYFSLLEDIYDFNIRMKEDFSLYKIFKSHLLKNINRLKNNQVFLQQIRQNFKDLPKHLDIFEIANQYAPKNNSSKNKAYLKILDTFYKFDLKGYKTDGNFNNMFDDSLHTFYAAHCDFFVTNDERCNYKAKKTYERIGISTIVIKAQEYNEILKVL